jgi:hypothetical protein
MSQTMYAHMNKIKILKKVVKIFCSEFLAFFSRRTTIGHHYWKQFSDVAFKILMNKTVPSNYLRTITLVVLPYQEMCLLEGRLQFEDSPAKFGRPYLKK